MQDLNEPGQGFTPNSTVTLHFLAPDGNHYILPDSTIERRINNATVKVKKGEA